MKSMELMIITKQRRSAAGHTQVLLLASVLSFWAAFDCVAASGDTGAPVIELHRNAKWVTTGQPITVALECIDDQRETEPRPVKVSWNLYNDNEEGVDSGQLSSTLSPKASEHFFEWVPDRNGSYRLEVQVESGLWETNVEALFSVFPPFSDQKVTDNILGATGIVQPYKELARICGVTWHRRHCCRPGKTAWQYIVKDGKWNWGDMQKAEELEKDLGLTALGSLDDWRPGWRTKMQSDPDAYIHAFIEDYLKPMVSKSKDHIRYWEVLNEPYYPYEDTPETYVALLKASYEAIKEIDPEIKVVGICGPPGSMGPEWYHQTFKRGALAYLDIVSFHQYSFSSSLRVNPEQPYLKWFSDLKTLIGLYGHRDYEIWNSESSLTPPATMYRLSHNLERVQYRRGAVSPDPHEQAAAMTRILTVHYAHNIKYFFHLFNGGTVYDCHPCEDDGTPIPLAVSIAAVNRFLAGKESFGDAKPQHLLSAYVFGGNGLDTVAVIWLLADEQFADMGVIELPPGLGHNMVSDIFANRLGGGQTSISVNGEPIYLTFPGLNPQTVFELLKTVKVSRERKLFSHADDAGLKRASAQDWLGFYQVDLKENANASFTDETSADDHKGGFTDEGHLDLRYLPVGDFVINDIPFRILDPKKNHGNSCIVLSNKRKPYFPNKITIRIGKHAQRISKLHFLHLATNGWWDKNKEIARYRVRYEDGVVEEIPVVMGQNVQNWMDLTKPSEAKLAWKGLSPGRDNVAVWHYELKLSHPKGAAAAIESIEVVSDNKLAVPVILSITGVLSN